ncbi:MAG: carbohydrate binding family 9 domain-containing protein [Chitinophagaceae bacterium]|nr:carbohydrate binding family 9 domain-containing protein [Chitinophagaceae bacterium]
MDVPKIDGLPNDPVWKDIVPTESFTQTIPSPDKPSEYATEIRMCYTNTSLYILAVMHQPAKLMNKQMTARDALGNVNADVFSVFLDTYDDKQNGFAFRVSSAGVLQDERISGGGEYGDVSWDAVWNARTQIQEDQWVAEMEIPFSALRFSMKEEQQWGINFLRIVRKKNENSYWNKINVMQQGFLAQSGLLTGLKHVMPPVRLFLFPYLSTGYLQQPEAGVTTQRWLKSGGLDLKYGINESFTLDMTLIPDFSQVISDNVVRNLSPFEQQLTENRPFFTEGTELFNKAGLFYSRRVGATPTGYYSVKYGYSDTSKYEIKKNPNVTSLYNAFKFSGRNKHNLGIGIFNAVGTPEFAVVKDKLNGKSIKIETEPLTNYNVLVLDKTFKGQSYINFTNTNVFRNGVATDANVSSLQLVKFSKTERFTYKLVPQLSVQNGFSRNVGSAIGAEIAKVSGNLTWALGAESQSPLFDRSDMGIQFQYNNSNQYFRIGYEQNKPKYKFLQFYSLSTNHQLHQNTKPFAIKYYQAEVNAFFLLKNFWDFTLGMESKPFAPIDYYQLGAYGKKLWTYPYLYSSLNGSSDSRKKLFWAYYFGYGFSNGKHTDYVYLEQSLRYQFNAKLEVTVGGNVTRDNSNIGFAYYDAVIEEPIAGRRDVREYNGQLSVKYNINPNTNFTARFRHYNSFISYLSFHQVNEAGYWKDNVQPFTTQYNENFNLQNVDVFFNWMFRPGSRIVVSYKQWLSDAYLLNQQHENGYFKNAYQIIQTPKAFEIAVRFIYFLDYNQLKKHS